MIEQQWDDSPTWKLSTKTAKRKLNLQGSFFQTNQIKGKQKEKEMTTKANLRVD